MKTIDEIVMMVLERGGLEYMPHFILGTTFASHYFKHVVNAGGEGTCRLSTSVAYIEPARIMAATIKGELGWDFS